jgi:hypothetical protein
MLDSPVPIFSSLGLEHQTKATETEYDYWLINTDYQLPILTTILDATEYLATGY